MLNARAESLAPELLREGVKDGHFFTAGSIDGERGQSLKVNLSGPRKGCWTDFSAAKGSDDYSGDMLSMIAVVFYGGRGKEQLRGAIGWAKGWLGIEGADPQRIDRARHRLRAVGGIERAADAIVEVGVADRDQPWQDQAVARGTNERFGKRSNSPVVGEQDPPAGERHWVATMAYDQPGGERVGKAAVRRNGEDGRPRRPLLRGAAVTHWPAPPRYP